MTTPAPNPKPLPALAIVAAVLLMAGAMTAVFVLGRTKHDSPQSKEPAQTSSASAADPLSESPAKDDQFLWRLKLQGLQLQLSNDAASATPVEYAVDSRAGKANTTSFRTS